MSSGRQPLGEYRQPPAASQQPLQSTPPTLQRFHSLEELLKNAGYKDTRVITPDAKALAYKTSDLEAHSAQTLGSLASHSRGSAALRQLERTAAREGQQRFRKMRTVQGTGWMSSWWGADKENERGVADSFGGCGGVRGASIPEIRLSSDTSMDVTASECAVRGHGSSMPVASLPQSPSKHVRSAKRITRPLGTLSSPSSPIKADRLKPTNVLKQRNEVWLGSIAYRGSHTRSAPARTAHLSGIRTIDSPSTSAIRVYSGGPMGRKQRPALREVFSRPLADSEASEASTVTTRSEVESHQFSNKSGVAVKSQVEILTIPPVRTASQSLRLVGSVARPVLSGNAAVALRNEGCLRPNFTDTGAPALRHMRSIDALRQAISGHDRTRRMERPTKLDDGSSVGSRPHPTLIVTTPRGLNSPQILDLAGLSPQSVPKYDSTAGPSRNSQATHKRIRRKRSEGAAARRSSSSESRTRKQRPSILALPQGEGAPAASSPNASSTVIFVTPPVTQQYQIRKADSVAYIHGDPFLDNATAKTATASSDEEAGLILQRGRVQDLQRRAASAARPASRIPISANGSPKTRAARLCASDSPNSSPTINVRTVRQAESMATSGERTAQRQPRPSGSTIPRLILHGKSGAHLTS